MVYMGGRTAALLAGRLIAEGMPPATPAVVVENATRHDERIERTTLAGLTARPILAAGPVMLTIGRVFAQSHEDRVVTCSNDSKPVRIIVGDGGHPGMRMSTGTASATRPTTA